MHKHPTYINTNYIMDPLVLWIAMLELDHHNLFPFEFPIFVSITSPTFLEHCKNSKQHI